MSVKHVGVGEFKILYSDVWYVAESNDDWNIDDVYVDVTPFTEDAHRLFVPVGKDPLNMKYISLYNWLQNELRDYIEEEKTND